MAKREKRGEQMKTALADRAKVRDKTLIVSVSEKEKQFITEKAREYGMTTSSFCRWFLMKNLKEE